MPRTCYSFASLSPSGTRLKSGEIALRSVDLTRSTSAKAETKRRNSSAFWRAFRGAHDSTSRTRGVCLGSALAELSDANGWNAQDHYSRDLRKLLNMFDHAQSCATWIRVGNDSKSREPLWLRGFESPPLRHTVWHASLDYGEAMKSARGRDSRAAVDAENANGSG